MSDGHFGVVHRASAVAMDGRALLIEGEPGSGKSSLALALIHRGARLIGDDAVTLTRFHEAGEARLIASAPPNIEGLLEVRGVGLAQVERAEPAPVALILRLCDTSERLPERAHLTQLCSCRIPTLAFVAGSIAPAERALMALELHGL